MSIKYSTMSHVADPVVSYVLAGVMISFEPAEAEIRI